MASNARVFRCTQTSVESSQNMAAVTSCENAL